MGVGDEIELEVTLRPAERFAAVYAEHFDPLVRLAALLLGSTAAAEDVVQEAFAKLEPRLSSVVVPPAWLRTAVVNGCRNERRRLGTIRRHASRLAIGPSQFDEPVHELIASVRRLPYRQRAVVVLRFYLDLPEAEIAQILGVRPGTVKSSLHRAMARLESEIDR